VLDGIDTCSHNWPLDRLGIERSRKGLDMRKRNEFRPVAGIDEMLAGSRQPMLRQRLHEPAK